MGQVSTAAITGQDDEVCQGDSVSAYLHMTGNGPWTLVINDEQGEYLTLKEISSPYLIWLKPEEDNNYYIASVVDRNEQAGIPNGVVSVFVLPVTPVEIVLDRAAYLKSEPEVALVSNPSGAEFFGNGITGSFFYPEHATPTGSPHEITCFYTNSFECVSSDTIDIHVIHGESDVVLVSGADTINTVCDDNVSYEIRGSNLDNMAGTFALSRADSIDTIPGHIVDADPGDNQAILNTTGLTGAFDLVYIYEYDVLTVEERQRIYVNDLTALELGGLPEVICNTDDPYLIYPDKIEDDPDATYTISGPGVSGSQAQGYYFDPGQVGVGSFDLTVEYTSSNGCYFEAEQTIDNHFTPTVSFTFSPACVSPNGGIVSFTNTTSGKFAVETWGWDFGDPDSGDQNTSGEENPEHLYGSPGWKQISLHAYTMAGCEASTSMDTVLIDRPVVDFLWFHDCFIRGEKICVVDRSSTSFSAIDTLIWTFLTEKGGVLGVIGSGSSEDTIRFPFTSQSNYQIQLEVMNEKGCQDKVTKELSLKPTIPLTSDGYVENFNGNDTKWRKVSENLVSSWVLGTPDFKGFEPDTGDMAWYTDLPYVDAAYLDRSWIESPCFDFTQTSNPSLELDLMKSFVPRVDGAVMQYSLGTGEGWKTLGFMGEGTNWYNVSGIQNAPGGSDFGWGLEQFNPDRDWVTASHDLDMVAGNPHVRFRIVLGTGSGTARGNKGFAFDNISISERIRLSVLEHFTNAAQDISRSADDIVEAFVKRNSGKVIDLQYHLDYPGPDTMNANNPYPPSSREGYYGVPSPPYAILNGRAESDFRYDFSAPSENPSDEILKQVSQEFPPFFLDLDVEWTDQSLDVTVTTSCIVEAFSPNVQLYTVVLESLVTAYTGLNQDTVFRNVVLDMLPHPGGSLLGNDWQNEDFVTKTYHWDYAEYIEDIEDLVVVAFILDRDNFDIMHAVASYRNPEVGIRKPKQEARALSIYPNPATETLYVNLGGRATQQGSLLIIDVSGRIVMEQEVKPGYAIHRLEISSLPQGMYMICWVESGLLKGLNKLVRTR